jgi:hypothetical protein
LLILYHMVTARAAVAVGGEGARSEDNGAQDEGQEAAAEES